MSNLPSSIARRLLRLLARSRIGGSLGEKLCREFSEEREKLTDRPYQALSKGEGKVFVVSNNKCGTTTMASYFRSIGMDVAPQAFAEALTWDWTGAIAKPGGSSKNYWVTYIDSHEVFQDVPFSRASALPWLIMMYPSARYVYVERAAADWYVSLVNHHFTRIFGADPMFDDSGNVIWSPELAHRADVNRYQGADLSKDALLRFGTTPSNPYDRDTLVGYHNRHVAQAKRLLPQVDSIVLALGELTTPQGAERMANFLDLSEVVAIPHLNKADKSMRR